MRHLFSRKNLLILIILFFILNNLIWWENNKFIQGPDEARHLFNSIYIYNSNNYAKALLNFLKIKIFDPPLYYFTSCIFYKIFQNTSYRISMLNNILYIILFLIGISKLERSLLGTSGIFSAFFLMFIPAVGVHSRFFNPDIALCGIMVWFIYFIKKLNDTANWRYFLILILLIFLGGVTKVSFYLFSIFPIAYYFFLALKRKKAERITFNFILGLALFSLFIIIYHQIFNFNISYGCNSNFMLNISADPNYLQQNLLGKIYQTITLIINAQISGVIFVLFLFSFFLFIISPIKREDKFSMIVFFFGWLFIFLIINLAHLEARFFLPLVIPEVIVISYGAHFLFKRKIAFRFIVIAFILFSIAQYYGISYSKNWIDFFPKFKIFNREIHLSYYPATAHDGIAWSLPYPDNPLEEVIDILYQSSKKGISPNVCFVYDQAKDSFVPFLSHRLFYYLLRKGYIVPTVYPCGYGLGDIYDMNFFIVNRSYVKNKNYIFGKEALYENKYKSLKEAGPLFTTYERYLEQAKFQLYKEVNIYNPIENNNESLFIYLKKQ